MIKIQEDLNKDLIKIYGLDTPGGKIIMYKEEIVGMIDYNVYDNRIKINYITVQNQYRQLGIAKEVITNIMNDNKGKYVCGDALPGAIGFWKKLGAEFYEDPFDDYLTPFTINN